MRRNKRMMAPRVLTIVAFVVLAMPSGAIGAEPAAGDTTDKLYEFGVRLGGNTSWLRSGKYYRGTSTDFGYDADIVVPLSRRIALVATVAKAGIDVETDPTIIGLGTATEYIYRNYDVSAWRYFISAEYSWDWLFKRLAEKGIGRTIMGIKVGLGAITHKHSVSAVIYPEDGPAMSDTQTKFSVTSGYCYTQMLGKRIGVYVLSELDIVFLGNPPDAEVHWKENRGLAFLDHLRFGLTVVF